MTRSTDGSLVIAAEALVLLALTHGAPSVANRAGIMQLVDSVAGALPGHNVSIAFLDVQHTDIADALDAFVTTEHTIILPLVLSAGFHMRTGIAKGLRRLERVGAGLADELGPDDRLVQVLAERIEELGLSPADSVVLAAAGSSDARAVRECFETGRRLAVRLGRPVTVGFIAAAMPRLHDAIEMVREVHPGTRVVVGTYLLAPGNFNDAVLSAGGDIVAAPLLIPDRVAPSQLVELVLERYATAVEELAGQ
ncbi:MAG: CbiX/SirB N-terminal domain-containing protein [Leifsonia sp.]